MFSPTGGRQVRSLGWRPGAVNVECLRHAFPPAKRVVLAPLRELDDLLGDSIRLGMIAVEDAESAANVGVRAGHGRDRFPGLIQYRVTDVHYSVHLVAGEFFIAASANLVQVAVETSRDWFS